MAVFYTRSFPKSPVTKYLADFAAFPAYFVIFPVECRGNMVYNGKSEYGAEWLPPDLKFYRKTEESDYVYCTVE